MFYDSESSDFDKTIPASLNESPRELVLRALEKDNRPNQPKRKQEDCLLRVVGRNDFL